MLLVIYTYSLNTCALFADDFAEFENHNAPQALEASDFSLFQLFPLNFSLN